jgi:glutathione S-transferase
MSLALYGHPFSSYTWKAMIALHAAQIAFDFRIVDPDHPENGEVVQTTGPLGKFPVLVDGKTRIFEATSIVEHIALHHAPDAGLLPFDASEAARVRMMDRVFDNYVMAPMQAVVDEYLRAPENPDMARVAEQRGRLDRTYGWLEAWLGSYELPESVTLIECAAAPSLFYADWVHPIADGMSRLKRWRAHLLALPPVAKCVDAARPYRAFFPLGAPDRD